MNKNLFILSLICLFMTSCIDVLGDANSKSKSGSGSGSGSESGLTIGDGSISGQIDNIELSIEPDEGTTPRVSVRGSGKITFDSKSDTLPENERPEEVVNKFTEAISSGNYEELPDFCFSKKIKGRKEIVKIYKTLYNPYEGKGLRFTIGEAVINGDNAEVEITAVIGNEKTKSKLFIIKRGEKWKINLDS